MLLGCDTGTDADPRGLAGASLAGYDGSSGEGNQRADGMVTVVEQNRDTLRRLCERCRVKRLELFGSAAAGGSYDRQGSDLDFLVEFLPLEPGTHADAYFGLLAALEDLFERPVDLVMTPAIRNPYFLESVNRTRTMIYAA